MAKVQYAAFLALIITLALGFSHAAANFTIPFLSPSFGLSLFGFVFFYIFPSSAITVFCFWVYFLFCGVVDLIMLWWVWILISFLKNGFCIFFLFFFLVFVFLEMNLFVCVYLFEYGGLLFLRILVIFKQNCDGKGGRLALYRWDGGSMIHETKYLCFLYDHWRETVDDI